MKVNPKQIERMMKQMGVKTEQISAEEVIIRTPDKELIIAHPEVAKVNMMGQETFQISGEVSERAVERFSREDIAMVRARTGASEEEARRALTETGDLAEAILKLKK